MEDHVTLTSKSSVDDPDIYQIDVVCHLKPGKKGSDLDSFAQERALLKYVSGLITWFQYCRDTGMKTLPHVEPVYEVD